MNNKENKFEKLFSFSGNIDSVAVSKTVFINKDNMDSELLSLLDEDMADLVSNNEENAMIFSLFTLNNISDSLEESEKEKIDLLMQLIESEKAVSLAVGN